MSKIFSAYLVTTMVAKLVKLPPNMLRWLRREAKKQEITVSELMRSIIRQRMRSTSR